jgi:hypothetical protein
MVKLSAPAYMTLIAALIMAVVILLPTSIRIYDPDTDSVNVVEYNLKKRLVMLLFLSLPMAIHIYSVNCLTVGSCNLFAWFVASLIVLWVIAFVIIAFIG